MTRDKKSKNRHGYLQSSFYGLMIETLQSDKKESRFQSLRDLAIYWGDAKYLLPRSWPYGGPRKSPMQIYFNMRKPQASIPMHSHHDYIKYCITREWKRNANKTHKIRL